MKGIEKGPTLGDQVYAYIREGIVNQRYRPGEMLVESELALELNVSRTPVSNAVIMLKERGLLEVHGGRFVVLDLSIRDVIDLYQCRLAFDGMAARLAAENMSEARLRDLENGLDIWEQVIDAPDTNALWVADLGFHSAIYEGSGNTYLQRFSEIATDLLSTYRRVIIENLASHPDQSRSPDDVRREHLTIYEALSARDPDAAETQAREHIQRVIEFLNRVLDNSGAFSEASSLTASQAGAGDRR